MCKVELIFFLNKILCSNFINEGNSNGESFTILIDQYDSKSISVKAR